MATGWTFQCFAEPKVCLPLLLLLLLHSHCCVAESYGHAEHQTLQLSRGSTWNTQPSSEGAANSAALRPSVRQATASQTVLTVLEESPSSAFSSKNGTVGRPRASGVWNWLRRSTIGMGATNRGLSTSGTSQHSSSVAAGWRSWAGMGLLRSSRSAAQAAVRGTKSRTGGWSGSGRSYHAGSSGRFSEGRASLSRMKEDADHVRALLAEQQVRAPAGRGVAGV